MKIEVLDHGYVEFIEAWGRGKAGADLNSEDERMLHQIVSSDFECGIIEAARQSTQGCFRGWEEDEKLLKYLYEHKHNTPFEFSGMAIEVQAPIFVFREWQRHRTESYNEMSARYEPLPALYYMPDQEVLADRILAGQQKTTKQAKGQPWNKPEGYSDLEWAQLLARDFLAGLRRRYADFEDRYREDLKEGIPNELARCGMPVGHYSRMRASANLRNWLAFLTLRLDPAAQWEIRQFAQAVGQIIADKFPRTWELFCQERKSK